MTNGFKEKSDCRTPGRRFPIPTPRSSTLSKNDFGKKYKSVSVIDRHTLAQFVPTKEVVVCTADDACGSDFDAIKQEAQVSDDNRDRVVQARPLPNVPSVGSRSSSTGLISTEITNSNDTDESIYIAVPLPNDENVEKDANKSIDESVLTLKGTVRRNRHQNLSNSTPFYVYDVELTLTPDRLNFLENKVNSRIHNRSRCRLECGPHILLISLSFVPLFWIYSTIYSFSIGTLLWYNVFLHYHEQRSLTHKILLSPFILLIYPFWICPVCLFLGLICGLTQVSWHYNIWLNCIHFPDAGFFAWISQLIHLPECCPYQVVLIHSAHEHEINNRHLINTTNL